MEYVFICLTALLASFLTLFSGFGLSTVLMPIFAIFFPIPIAIAATAVVHLTNNLFKLAIVGRYTDWRTILIFGVPATLAAMLGAYFLGLISYQPPLFSYSFLTYQMEVTRVGIVIGTLIVLFACLELIPCLSYLSFSRRVLMLGGLLSGFFGGLSGYQGALRSVFLIRASLNKEQYIGTSVACSVIVDAIRLFMYGWSTPIKHFIILFDELLGLVAAASLAAFLGAYLGAKFIPKITYDKIQKLVSLLLVILGILIVVGFTQFVK